MADTSYRDRIYEMDYYTRRYNLILNRVKVINDMFYAHYGSNPDNPCQLERTGRGSWRVTLCELEVCSWRVWDVPGVEAAFERVDLVTDVIWYVRRAGWLDVPEPEFALA